MKFEDLEGHNFWETNKPFFDKARLQIQRNCGEILKVYKNTWPKMTYRGLRSNHPVLFSHIDKERVPGYLERSKQIVIDQSLSNLGMTALRGNSIFCAGERVARTWGSNCYAVFPVNGYSFTWYPHFYGSVVHGESDYLYTAYAHAEHVMRRMLQVKPDETRELIQKYGGGIDFESKAANHDGYDEADYLAFINIFHHTEEGSPYNQGLEQAIDRSSELLITGRGYYGVYIGYGDSTKEWRSYLESIVTP